jgi:hypothetical protein
MGGGGDDDKRQTQPDVGKDGGSASLEVLSYSSVIVRGAHYLYHPWNELPLLVLRSC